MSILSRNYRYRFSAMMTGYRWRISRTQIHEYRESRIDSSTFSG